MASSYAVTYVHTVVSVYTVMTSEHACYLFYFERDNAREVAKTFIHRMVSSLAVRHALRPAGERPAESHGSSDRPVRMFRRVRLRLCRHSQNAVRWLFARGSRLVSGERCFLLPLDLISPIRLVRKWWRRVPFSEGFSGGCAS